MNTSRSNSHDVGPWVVEWCCTGDQRGLFNIDSLRQHTSMNYDLFLGRESTRYRTSWIIMGIFPTIEDASQFCAHLEQIQDGRGGPQDEDTRIIPFPADQQEMMRSYMKLLSLPYAEYLKTEHWQRVREYALTYAKHRCQICNASGLVDVHHRTYEHRGREHMEDVIVLCRDCHTIFHDRLAAGRRGDTNDAANA